MIRLSPDEIEHLTLAALRAHGAAEAAARSVARSVRRAEEDGIRAVGLGYLPIYLAHLRSGKVDGGARPRIVSPRGGTVLVDAGHGFAHPAFDAGLPVLAAAARAQGIAAMGIRCSYSIGVLGHPVEDIANEGLVGLAFTNSPPNIAPWGGKRPLFGTNPMALACPRRDRPPLVIDQATSVVTKVRLTAAAKAGKALPEGWALDSEGQPTTDATAALKGSMMPFGGAKGAALALIVELLGAALVGANLSKDASPYARPDGPPPGVGQFFIAIDAAAFADGMADRIAELSEAILADEGARLPGDRRLEVRLGAERDGIAVDEPTLTMLKSAQNL
jgi:(2R)-3-sulfolactate dehydrogenase (NADP+)